MTNRLVSAVRGVGGVIADTYRLGGRAWRVAPLLVAIAVVPEFLQHVVEIKLGMFESLARFHQLALDPTRWLFGYAKLAGMVIAMLAIARFWAVGSVRDVFRMPPRDLGQLALAIGLTVIVALGFDRLEPRNGPAAVRFVLQAVSFLIQAGLTLYVAAALFGDRALTLKTAFTERWPTALVLTLAAFCAFMPRAQLLHMANHKIALGQPAAIVWALMIWDSLVVGLLASLVGSALWAGYRSGATWRGWEPKADAEPVGEAVAEAAVVAPEEAPAAPEPRQETRREAYRRRRAARKL